MPAIIFLAATLGNQLENPALVRILVLGLGGLIPAGFVLSKIVREVSCHQPYFAEIDALSKSPKKKSSKECMLYRSAAEEHD